ncbi:hypothetical protein ACUUL3_04235 [Thiovibrio sp. JS02]
MNGKGWRFLLLALFLLPVRQVEGFGRWQGEETSLELRGFSGLGAAWARNPEDTPYYDSREDLLANLEQRFLLTAGYGENSRLEANVLQYVRHTQTPAFAGSRLTASGVERSGLLAWQQHGSGNSQANLSVDTLSLHHAAGPAEFSIGRQPVNLATTFYFSPNDFFAPFAAQSFFRAYKSGVDAARAEVRLGPLSQLSLLGVFGYAPDSGTGNGWANRPDWDRNSLLGRVAVGSGGFEWAFLAGSVREHRIVGGSFAGEFLDWLGIRAEGHYAAPERDGLASGSELALGLEHRFANSLDLRLEHFFHGQGLRSGEDMAFAIPAGDLPEGYTGRQYSALGAGYEFSPLFSGQAIFLKNWSDHSQLVSINGVYSLSDEAELACTLSLPMGRTPEQERVRSEFGLLARMVALEFRIYY